MTNWSSAEMHTEVNGFTLRVTPGQPSVAIDEDSLTAGEARELAAALNEAVTIAETGAISGAPAPVVKESERTTARIFRDGDSEPEVATVLVDASGDFWMRFFGGWVCDSVVRLNAAYRPETSGSPWGTVLNYAPLIEFRPAR